MGHLSLNAQESTVLAQALDSYLSDLRVEIAGTDGYDLREALKGQEEILSRILLALRGEGGDEAPGRDVPLM
jgi:hypothetical protein